MRALLLLPAESAAEAPARVLLYATWLVSTRQHGREAGTAVAVAAGAEREDAVTILGRYFCGRGCKIVDVTVTL